MGCARDMYASKSYTCSKHVANGTLNPTPPPCRRKSRVWGVEPRVEVEFRVLGLGFRVAVRT